MDASDKFSLKRQIEGFALGFNIAPLDMAEALFDLADDYQARAEETANAERPNRKRD